MEILQYKPMFDREDLQRRFADYIASDGWFTEHHNTKEFERSLANLLQTPSCSMVNNGTVSLSIALLAAGVHPGDEVLVPDFTMIATVNAVKFIGAVPVLVDVDADSLCMNWEDACRKRTGFTRALIFVTMNGRSGNNESLRNLAKRNDLVYIEDDAQSLCSRYPDGKYIGTECDMASFSFSMPKIITTGQGGCIVTSDPYYANKVRQLKDFGRERGGNDIHDHFGINSKFTEMQAVLGISQFDTLSYRAIRKRYIYEKYRQLLYVCPEVKFLPTHDNTVPWFVDVYVGPRDDLTEFLLRKGIHTRKVYPAIHTQRSVRDEGSFPNATWAGEHGLWLPCSLDITDEEIHTVCLGIKEYYG